MLLRETGLEITTARLERLRARHAEAYRRFGTSVCPLPGAVELLRFLSERQVPWAIATSGRMETAGLHLGTLGVDPNVVPVVTRDQVEHAKPDPDLFLAAADRLGHPIEDAFVVGDSIWDLLAARRAKALSIGLLTGGYGEAELERSGAFRVFASPADLLKHIDEVGVRR